MELKTVVIMRMCPFTVVLVVQVITVALNIEQHFCDHDSCMLHVGKDFAGKG